jgi:hypothetical protein
VAYQPAVEAVKSRFVGLVVWGRRTFMDLMR